DDCSTKCNRHTRPKSYDISVKSACSSLYLTRKVASWACTLSSGFTSEATAAACSLGAVFAAAATLEKTSLSPGERRRDSINRNKQIRRNHMSQKIKVCTIASCPR